jgi:hypothetical protein
LSTDFKGLRLLQCVTGMLQCNITALKNVIDGCRRKELLSFRQSGIILRAAGKMLIHLVLIDGDKIQFASAAAAVQDYSAEAEKPGSTVSLLSTITGGYGCES